MLANFKDDQDNLLNNNDQAEHANCYEQRLANCKKFIRNSFDNYQPKKKEKENMNRKQKQRFRIASETNPTKKLMNLRT